MKGRAKQNELSEQKYFRTFAMCHEYKILQHSALSPFRFSRCWAFLLPRITSRSECSICSRNARVHYSNGDGVSGATTKTRQLLVIQLMWLSMNEACDGIRFNMKKAGGRLRVKEQTKDDRSIVNFIYDLRRLENLPLANSWNIELTKQINPNSPFENLLVTFKAHNFIS